MTGPTVPSARLWAATGVDDALGRTLEDLPRMLGRGIEQRENVKAFDVRGDGVTDDTDNIQKAVDYCMGAGSALSVARTGVELLFPPGTYKITRPITAHSTRGLHIKGAGPNNTKIKAMADMSQVFELDGFSLGSMSGLIISGDSSHTVTRGVYLHWDNAVSASSTYGNVFKQVYVEGATLNCDVGWAVGTDSTRDVSRNLWLNCITAGGQASAQTGGTWSDPKWQYGWLFGNGSVGNVLDNILVGCSSDHWLRGISPQGANLTVVGGEIMHNAVDFYHLGAVAGPLLVEGIRSEWSERLYDSVVNGNPGHIKFDGVEWKTDHMPADNFVIRFLGGGTMIVDASQFMAGTRPSASTPKIQIGSSRASMLHVRGVAVDNTPPASFVDNSGSPTLGQYRVDNYTQVDGTTGVQTTHMAHGFASDRKTLTYSATIATDCGIGRQFAIVATNGTAFTISNPTNALTGVRITYDIKNSSGGALGVITWGAAFLLAGAFTNPANGKRRTITFCYDGTNWVEESRAAADI